MGHVICSVKTGPIQSIVKLNVFNYFEEKSKVALNKYEKAVERNNENNFAFCYSFSSSSLFSKSESESLTKLTIIGGYVMDAKVSRKPCSCPSFKILYILLGLKPVQHLGGVLF
jgi:hypothetical protein